MTSKILIIGPSWVGDMVMAQTLFKILKQNSIDTQIDVLAPDWSLPVLERMPEITTAISLPITHGEFGFKKRWQLARELKKHNYTQAIVLANSWKSALIPFLAGIPLRTGWFGEVRWGLLNDVRYLNKKLLPKMVQRYAALGFNKRAQLPTDLPAPRLNAPDLTVAAVINKFSLNVSQPILALCPGAAYGPAKRWPEQYFANIAKQRINDGWQVWLFGSQQDNEVIENIRTQIGAATISFAAQINLMETIDLLSVANAVVTNDSGLLHIAASLNKPLVAIYGSTSAEFTPPLGKKSKVMQESLACRPCFKRECPLQHLNCMHAIKPERVLKALNELEEV